MGKIKIYEIAKKLDLTSKEVLEIAKNLNIDVKSHLSGVDEKEAQNIEENIDKKGKNISNKKINESESQTKEVKKEKGETPVIIRREVIISDDESKKKNEEEKKKENRNTNNNVGFVERKQNNNYNIVYRNKPTKPMTVEELLGKKDKKEEIKIKESKGEEEKEDMTKKEAEQPKKQNIENVKVDNINQNEKNGNMNNVNNLNMSKNNNFNNNSDKNQYDKNKNDLKSNINQNNSNMNGNITQRNNNYQGNNQNRNNNYKGNSQNRNNNYQGNSQNRNNNYQGNNQNRNNNYQGNNQNRNNNYKGNNQNRNNNYQNNNQNKNNNFQGNNQNRNNNYQSNSQNRNSKFNNSGQRYGNRPLDEKGIEKNIKNIMTVETGNEKDNSREYSKAIDKKKVNSKFDENKTNKKSKKSRKNSQTTEINEGKLKSLKQTNQLSNMFDDQEGGMLDYYDLTTQRGKRGKKKNNKNDGNRVKQRIFKLTEITIPDSITVKDLATELKKTTAEVIKKLMGYGVLATLNNEIDFDTAYLVAGEFGITALKKEVVTEEDILFDDSEDKEEELKERPPVVVVMGHVDHGKTSLLDAVKQTNVIEGEAGGITQHIGAYKVKVNDREITFLDTPGHEAFTAMRARGAQITDIAILVVAANDGVKPQTVEAINHAKSAGIPIIVAINKIDLPDSNIDKVKQELMSYELVPEEWGGDTIYVPISAKKHENIDQLLEMVLLQADMLELKANPTKQAKGVVIEARLDKSRGAIATMLVQRGKLDIGDTVVVGSSIGRIRAMTNDKGKKVKFATPSTPVEILGLTEVPEAGDTFYEVKDEKTAKHLIERRKRQAREKSINATSKVTLDNLFSEMEKGNLKQLELIVKADVQGSVEAVKQSLERLSNDEVRVKVIHAATGAVTETDVTLANVANAIIIAFNVRPVASAREMAERDEVEIKQYSVIYQAIEDVEAAMKGMLDPEFEEKVIGTVEVRQTFKISSVGTIAGAYVLTGKIQRHAGVRVIREDVVIHDGTLASLKRFKDDAKEVAKGFECGIQIEGYNDIKEGDIIEVYVMEEVKR